MARPCALAILLWSYCLCVAIGGRGDQSADKAALLALRDAVGRHLAWNSSGSPCDWVGIHCLRSRVVAVTLPAARLRGRIPDGTVGNLTELRVLRLRLNALSGSIPADLANCRGLRTLYLQHNRLSGPLPRDFSPWPNMVRLNLGFNGFNGTVPASLDSLRRLGTLYLENNSLSGSLPALENLGRLAQFNVSNNRLRGAVPPALRRFPAAAFGGNSMLCDPPLRSCEGGGSHSRQQQKKKKKLGAGAIAGIVVGGAAGGFALMCAVVAFGMRGRNVQAAGKRDKQRSEVVDDSYSKDEYSSSLQEPDGVRNRLVFLQGGNRREFALEDLLRASAEVLGKGSVGTAYKAILEVGMVVVVKRLRDLAMGPKEFVQHVNVVGRMSHENLVCLRCYYFSPDEKLLVYDFMPMGSLSALLHGNRGAGKTPLNWETRVRIALGAAKGIEYLHEQGSKITHGNIKSSNVLLTPDYNARVSDFCLVPFAKTGYAAANKIVGYRAPEVTDISKISKKSDVYSFGVLLLELLTGKEPTQVSLSDEGVDLPRWVESVVREEWTAEVFDLELMKDEYAEEDMLQLLQVAMTCVAQYPDQRPTMSEVVKMIKDISQKSGHGTT